MATCPNCGAENPDENRSCSECNQPLTHGDVVRCPMCSHSNPSDAPECQQCGARLRPMTPEELLGKAPPASPAPRPAAQKPPATPRRPPPSRPSPDDDAGLRSLFGSPGDDEEQPDAAPKESEEGAGWLSRLAGESERDATEEPRPETPPFGRNAPDRLADSDSEENGAEPELSETPSWLQQIPDEADETPSPEAREDSPSWLRDSIPVRPPPAAEETPKTSEPSLDLPAAPPETQSGAVEDAGVPSWLQDESPAAGAEAKETPDWLREIPSGESLADSEGDEEILSWLQALPDEPSTPIVDEDAPEWLRETLSGGPAEVAGPLADLSVPPIAKQEPPHPADRPEAPPGEAPIPDGDSAVLGQTPLEESIPSWLEEAKEVEPLDKPSPAFDVSALEDGATDEADVPGWLEDAIPATASRADEVLGDEGELLSLLAELDEEEQEAVEAQTAVSIERAELPEWLRSQRPDEIEQILPEEKVHAPGAAESELKTSGPTDIEELRFESILGKSGAEEPRPELAGALKDMRGVLKAEPIFVAPQPDQILEDVVVTEEQAKRIEAVRGALAAEHEGAILDARQGALPIARWLATLLIFAALIVPIVVGFQPMPAPQTRSLAVREVIEVIDGLPEGSRVLLAFEYEPDTAGEIDVAAEAVASHLMDREAYLYAISTRTTGRDVAQRVLTDVADGRSDYAYGERWFNLGYLAGRPVGVRRLALGGYVGGESPLVRDYLGNPTGLMADDLYHFDAVILFSARPEEVRDWIEQIGVVTDMPMVAVVSAAAAPVVYPYEQSGQLAGVLNGFGDALTYSASTQIFGTELATQWNAQALASLTAAVLIFGGGILHGLIALRRQSERTR